jgi:hypothetical protein
MVYFAPPPPSRVADSFSSILALQHGGWGGEGGGVHLAPIWRQGFLKKRTYFHMIVPETEKFILLQEQTTEICKIALSDLSPLKFIVTEENVSVFWKE